MGVLLKITALSLEQLWKMYDAVSPLHVFAKMLSYLSLMLCFIEKPVIWFILQIKWLVSIWNAILGWNGLAAKSLLPEVGLVSCFFEIKHISEKELFVKLAIGDVALNDSIVCMQPLLIKLVAVLVKICHTLRLFLLRIGFGVC